MSIYDPRRSVKLAVAFSVVLALLVTVGGWSIFEIGDIVGNAAVVIEGNTLRGETVQRKVVHLKWAGKPLSPLNDEKVTELSVKAAARKCGFGKWFCGES